jgi:hypothetical protein
VQTTLNPYVLAGLTSLFVLGWTLLLAFGSSDK